MASFGPFWILGPGDYITLDLENRLIHGHDSPLSVVPRPALALSLDLLLLKTLGGLGQVRRFWQLR